MWQKISSCLILLSLLLPSVSVFAQDQDIAAIESSVARGGPSCPIRLGLTMQERDSYMRFYAALSHLYPYYGTEQFEPNLESIVSTKWPKESVDRTSGLFYERVVNLVDQVRLRHSVAQLIGLDNKEWVEFERYMTGISVHRGIVTHVSLIEASARRLLKILDDTKRSPRKKGLEWDLIRAEALLRITDMHLQMMRWRAINGEILDEQARASAKAFVVFGVGLVSSGVIVATTIYAGPLLAGTGALAASLSSNPAVAGLLIRLGGAAGSSLLGAVGAPAATLMVGSYNTLTEAAKVSNNAGTSYPCELAKQIEQWKKRAPEEALSSAAFGASIGMLGSLATFNPKTAKLILYSTGIGVSVAQAYAVGKFGQKTVESIAYYKLAKEAEERDDMEAARMHLYTARDLAQQAGQKALESIIIATLTLQVGASFKQALVEGEAAILALWASSSDTVPAAANNVLDVMDEVKKATEKKLAK